MKLKCYKKEEERDHSFFKQIKKNYSFLNGGNITSSHCIMSLNAFFSTIKDLPGEERIDGT